MALWRPHRTDTDTYTGRGLQSGTDRPRSRWSRELGRPWRSRELGRPWRSRELERPWWDRLRDRGPSPHLSLFGRSPTTPPQNFLGEAQGYQEPSGANIQKQLKRPWSLTGQLRPRPAGLSIRQRPAGDTIIGWLDK